MELCGRRLGGGGELCRRRAGRRLSHGARRMTTPSCFAPPRQAGRQATAATSPARRGRASPRPASYDMVIVQHQGKVERYGRQGVDEEGDDRLPGRGGRSQHRVHRVPELIWKRLEGTDQVGPEADRVVVAFIQESQAYFRALRRSHCATAVVLPKPAGAITKVSLPENAASSLASRRCRGTSLNRVCGSTSLARYRATCWVSGRT